jgi:hypothetical protein
MKYSPSTIDLKVLYSAFVHPNFNMYSSPGTRYNADSHQLATAETNLQPYGAVHFQRNICGNKYEYMLGRLHLTTLHYMQQYFGYVFKDKRGKKTKLTY